MDEDFVMEHVFFDYYKHCVDVIFNQPKELNSMNMGMVNAIRKQLHRLETFKAVIFQGVGKAFSAGNDLNYLLTEVHKAEGKKAAIEEATKAFKKEFKLDYELATMRPIQISIWDGMVIGSGAGISIHSPIKIATDKTLFALPCMLPPGPPRPSHLLTHLEVKAGYFPAYGVTPRLKLLENGLGLYIALTGGFFKGEDVVKTGLADYYVKSDDLPALEAELKESICESTHLK